MILPHRHSRFWFEMFMLVLSLGETGLREWEKAAKTRHPRRKGYLTLRPGNNTPMWNLCCVVLKNELRPHGSKVRLARYLGIPKQRISDFLAGRRRMPDAEITLRMIHWVAAKRAGMDHSI
jgi:hypothetical protein